MTLEYNDWLEERKNDHYVCNGRKNAKIKQDCHGESQSLEHIGNHDPNAANKIYQAYVDSEANKEEKKKRKRE